MWAEVSYDGDGAEDTYDFSFPYLSREHIHAYVDGTEDTTFEWVDADTITLTDVPVLDAVVRIARETPLDELVVDFSTGGTFVEADFDTALLQILYALQEADDRLGGLLTEDIVTLAAAIDADADRAEAAAADVEAALGLFGSVYPVDAPTGVAATDTAAIQAQIDAANAADGGIVQLQGGTYVLQVGSGTLCLNMKSTVWLRGSGVGATILQARGDALVAGHLIATASSSYMKISDLTLDGNSERANPVTFGQSGGTHGIRLGTSVNHVWIENVEIKNTYHYGLGLEHSDGQTGCTYVWVTNLKLKDTGADGVDIKDYENTVHNIYFSNVAVDGWQKRVESAETQNAAFDIRGSGVQVKGLSVRGQNENSVAQVGLRFRFEVDEGAGLVGQGASDCVVTNFYIESSGDQAKGISIGGYGNKVENGTVRITGAGGSSRGIGVEAPSPSTQYDHSQHHIISNVLFDGTVIGSAASGDEALNIGAFTRGVHVKNCTFLGWADTAIEINDTAYGDVQISGCQFYNITDSAIEYLCATGTPIVHIRDCVFGGAVGAVGTAIEIGAGTAGTLYLSDLSFVNVTNEVSGWPASAPTIYPQPARSKTQSITPAASMALTSFQVDTLILTAGADASPATLSGYLFEGKRLLVINSSGNNQTFAETGNINLRAALVLADGEGVEFRYSAATSDWYAVA